MVARTIAAREPLGHRRQTFFVIYGGWDHHDATLTRQQSMLPVLSRALDELHRALVEMGVERQVTAFTISDFGRTLTTSGKGSDHGWGGNQIVMEVPTRSLRAVRPFRGIQELSQDLLLQSREIRGIRRLL